MNDTIGTITFYHKEAFEKLVSCEEHKRDSIDNVEGVEKYAVILDQSCSRKTHKTAF